MKILFVMRTTVYVRNFESTLRMLAERGHHVHVVGDVHHLLDPTDLIGRLAAEYPGITHGLPPRPPTNGWTLLGDELRRGVDYLRYLRPEYRDAPKLRQRAESNAPPFAIAAGKRAVMRSSIGLAALSRGLRRLDRALPIDPVVMDFVREHRPDLLIVTPLVEPGAPQAQYLRSARALGIRTALCVYSWDNLTNKGLIQDPLDLVTVWNEAMRQEAVTLHGVPADRVVVTGAAAYDHWFDWKPRQPRDAFCAQVGLPADRPYLLYLCSSKFIAPHEVSFVERWVTQLRAASPLLARTSVLIRPHPQNIKPWRHADLSRLGAVSVWPPGGANPVDVDSRADYYDSIFHSAGVVGVNTSAQIESAIVGRGVYTVLAPEFRDTQEGTLHFRHLRSVNGGLLHVAADFAGHITQLEGAVQNNGMDDGRCRRFVEAFVRPHGIHVPSTPKLVAAIETVASQPPPRPERAPWYAPVVRARLRAHSEQLVREEEQRLREELERQQAKENKAAARAKKDSAEKSAEPVLVGYKATRMAARAEKATARQLVMKANADLMANAVTVFADVRSRVQVMKALAPAASRLPQLAPLWQATPESVMNLRQLCHLVGGAAPAEYHNASDDAEGQFWFELRKLRREGGDQLLVSEPCVLGGFGFQHRERLYNGDTLRFYEVLAALKLGAVLPLFSASGPRRTVFEIGGGWGGFAYQFKSLFPNVTYVISGDPDAFLLSATYVRVMFPDARVRFYGEGGSGALWRDLEDVDFIFVPETQVSEVALPGVDLALDLLGLEQLCIDTAEQHVRRAAELGAPYFYSAAPGPGEDGSLPVRSVLERFYWLHELPVPQFNKRTALSGWPPGGQGRRQTRSHVMGWRRLVQ